MIPKYSSAECSAGGPARGNHVGQLMVLAIIAGVAGFGFLNLPHICGQSSPTASAPLPFFEVASIKPNHSADLRVMFMFHPGRLTVTGMTIKQVIAIAYNVKDFQILGGPSWISSERYDIDAKEEDSQTEAARKLPPDQMREHNQLMVQSLLADRFKLSVTHQSKELPVYALVVAKNGPKLQEAKPGDTYPNGIKGPDGRVHSGMGLMRMGGGEMTGQGIPMANLVMMLSQQLGRTVLDQTGMKGNYNVELKWTPDQSQPAMPMGPDSAKPPADNAPPPDTSGPSIFTAIQEQLGLKLESTKGPVEVLAIDHVERPSEN